MEVSLAVTLDPRLAEIAEREVREKQEQEAVAQAPVSPEESVPDATLETPDTAVEQNAEQVSEPVPAPIDNRLYIDPARSYQELTRLEQESEEVRNAIRTRVGRQAAKEYKPKLAELEHERNQLRAEIAQMKAQALDEDELKEKLFRDPAFRQQYDAQQRPQGPDPRVIAQLDARFNEAVEGAEQHLPPEIVGRYVQAMTQGQWYDYERNAQGQPLRPLSPEEGMRRFEADLNRAAINHIKQAQMAPPAAVAPPQQAAPKPVAQNTEPAPAPVVKPNLALAGSSPDLTQNNVQRSAGSMSLADYSAMNPPEKMRLFPEGLQAAIDSGKIYRD